MLGYPGSFCVARAILPHAPVLFLLQPLSLHLDDFMRNSTTSNGGPLGSCIDEERSKLRYVV